MSDTNSPPPIPINSMVVYDAMPPGGVVLLSLPHPTIPNERVFGAVDVKAFPNIKIATPIYTQPVSTAI